MAAELIKSILIDRQLAIGISLSAKASNELINSLFSNEPLDQVKLSNPFSVLPVISGTNLMQALLGQSAAMPASEEMMMLYLDGELEKAYLSSISFTSENKVINQYQDLIANSYRNAKEFDDFLESI